MKKAIVLLSLLSALYGHAAPSAKVSPIERGTLVTDMNGNGKSVTNLVSIQLGTQVLNQSYFVQLGLSLSHLTTFQNVTGIVNYAISQIPVFVESDPVWNTQKAGYPTFLLATQIVNNAISLLPPYPAETDPVWLADKSQYTTYLLTTQIVNAATAVLSTGKVDVATYLNHTNNNVVHMTPADRTKLSGSISGVAVSNLFTIPGSAYIPARQASGTGMPDTAIQYMKSATGDSLLCRQSDGRAKFANGTQSDDGATKAQLDAEALMRTNHVALALAITTSMVTSATNNYPPATKVFNDSKDQYLKGDLSVWNITTSQVWKVTIPANGITFTITNLPPPEFWLTAPYVPNNYSFVSQDYDLQITQQGDNHTFVLVSGSGDYYETAGINVPGSETDGIPVTDITIASTHQVADAHLTYMTLTTTNRTGTVVTLTQMQEQKEYHTDSYTNLIWRTVYSNGWCWLVAFTNTL